MNTSLTKFEIGKAYRVRELKPLKKSVAVFSTGAILQEVAAACDILEQHGIAAEQYSFPTVKPIDKHTIADCAARFDHIFTVEEHNIVGGFGSAAAEVLGESGESVRLHRLGIGDFYCSEVGTQAYLRDFAGISAQKIAQTIEETV